MGGGCNYLKKLSQNEIKCFNKVGIFYHLIFSFFDDLHLQIIQSISTILHWVKSSVCQQITVNECILNLLNPSTAGGGGGGLLLFLLIMCLQIYYWQCFRNVWCFRSLTA